MSDQSLKDKAVKGVAWSGIDNVAQNVITFIISVVLARLLSPDDYGLLGLIAIFTAISTVLINSGFKSALIRKETISDDDYNTAFIINVCISIVLYFVLFACAIPIARFFGRNELILLIRVSSLGIVLGAFALVQQTRLTKKIDFKTQTKITIIASISSGIIGIIMAILGYGVWSLVAQNLLRQLLTTVLLWFFNKWTPKWVFSKQSFNELFGYGWKMMISGILDTTWRELNQLVIGKYYDAASLGQYTRAKQFSNLVSDSITMVIQRVSFPVLSSIQSDVSRLASAYRRIIKVSLFISAPCLFLLGAVSEPLLYCLIGPQWHDAALFLPLLCINGTLFPLHVINLNMLQVQGRSDLFLGLEFIKKALAIGPLLIGAFVGIMPMLYAEIVVGVISFFLNSFYSGKLLGYGSLKQVKDITPFYGIALLVAIPVWALKYLPFSYWIILPIQLIVGASLFFVVCKLTRLEEYKELKDIVAQFFLKIKP